MDDERVAKAIDEIKDYCTAHATMCDTCAYCSVVKPIQDILEILEKYTGGKENGF